MLHGFPVRCTTTACISAPLLFSPLLKSFQKTLMALEDLNARNRAVAASKIEQATQLEEQADELLTEATKAQAIANNIKELLGEK